jgi:hypothetical protein
MFEDLAIPIEAKDSKLSRMDMNEPRSTTPLLTREAWSVYLSGHSVRRDMAHALAPLRTVTPACIRWFK